MSKKKRSKILATLLCATTMTAFYVSPQIGYAVDLYYKTDGSGEVVINGGGTNTKIEDLSGIASITFGTPGEQGEGGVRFFLDAQEFGGVRAEGAFTANDLYIMVDPKGEGTERYSLRNVMGIYRNQDQITGEYATSIESGISGGGMQITNDTINMLDGTIAISTENNAKYNISFDGKFNSEQGMTVGTDYTLDNRGNITTTGSISAKGTINGNEITENTFNEVTLDGGEVTADEVIADGYKLTEVGSTLKTIDDKTKGIISYTSENGTTFQGKITAYSGIVTSDVQTNTLNTTNIVSGNDSFTVHEAKEAIDWVDEWDSKVRDYDGRITQNETDIATLEKTVGDENSGLVKDVNDLQTATTGMTYNQSTGTTFSQAVTANDFKIADGTSLSQVASELTTAQGDIQTNANNITTLTGKVTIAEGEIGTLQTATTGMNYNSGTGTTFKQVVNATDFKVGDVTLTGVAGDLDTAEGKIIKNETAISGLGTRVTTAESEIGTLKSTTADHESRITANTNNITTLTGKVTTAEDEIDTLQTTVGEHDTDIKDLETKTHNISNDGNSITNLTNLTATTGTIGSVTFNGGTATGLNTIGTAADTVTVAGTAISNGSFNGVTIADYNTDGSNGATINGVSIYKDTNSDYIVGDVNISALTSGSGVTIEGIKRTDNGTEGHITTIEENLAINSNGEISNHNDSFKVDVDGTVTGKDFAIDSNTSLSGVAGDLDTAEGKITKNETAISGLGTRVTTAESEIGTLKSTTADHESRITANTNNITTLTGKVTTAEDEIDTLQTTVGEHDTDIKDLETKTHNISNDGNSITNLTNLTATTGTIGSVTFNGGTATGLNTIGTAADTVTVAGTAISNGSFNGVTISNYNSSGSTGATINGISIYKDTNSDYIVGDVNISALKGVSGTEIEGIERTDNTPDAADDNNFTTTIEGTLKVNTDGTFSNANESFKVDVDGNVTGKDFVINGVTSLSTVAQATTGMTYTAGNTTAEGVTSFDHNVHATNFTTDSADLNKLSATVGDDTSGLVKDVKTLESKTQGFSDDGKNLNLEGSIKANTGTIGNISFSNYAIGTDSDTITVAGTPISKGSFNGVGIKYENSNYWVGDVNLSELKANAGTVRGITYTNGTNGNYTMNFAEGAFSVSTTGEFTFNYNGKQYGLDKLINTVDTGDLEDFQELKDKVKNLEDKTTGISFDKDTGSTTISDMTGTDTDGDGINDSFTKGDNSLTVGDDGITANGDTVINGDTDDNTTGGNGNGSSDPQGGDSIINGDQLVNGDQHVTGDSQFDGTVTVGTGTDGKGQTVIDGGTINTGNTVIDGGQVKADEGHFGNITVGEDDNQTTIGDDGIKVGDNTTIDNSGVSIKDENGNVFMGDHDVVIKDSEGNVEASLSDVANRVDGIEQSIGDLNSRMGELEDRIDKVGAMAAAIANLRTMGYDPAAPTEVAVGIGQYRNETGAALGLFHYPNRDFMLSLSVSTSGDEVMGGIGATWKFGRKSPEKVAAEKAEKAREAKLQKAEAIKEAARLKKIEAQQERHAKLAAQKTATK